MTDLPQPWDFADAVAHAREGAEAQKGAEQARREATDALALAEQTYRVALAKRIVELNAEGAAWTVCQDLARGDTRVASLRYTRDVAKGVLDAAEQRAWRHAADRRDVLSLIEWSQRINAYGEQVAAA